MRHVGRVSRGAVSRQKTCCTRGFLKNAFLCFAAGGGPLTAFERKYVDAGEALHEVSTARRASEGRGAESPLSYV